MVNLLKKFQAQFEVLSAAGKTQILINGDVYSLGRFAQRRLGGVVGYHASLTH